DLEVVEREAPADDQKCHVCISYFLSKPCFARSKALCMAVNAVSAPFIICIQASAEAPCSRFISSIASSRRTRASSNCCRYLFLTSCEADSHFAICVFHWSICAFSFCTYSSRVIAPSSSERRPHSRPPQR